MSPAPIAQPASVLPKNLWNEKGELQRPASIFRNFISSDPKSQFPAEAGRYHLYVSYACPWAHRTLIVRKLKGLEDIIPFTSVMFHMDIKGETPDETGWKFATTETAEPDLEVTPDPLHPDFRRVRQLYYLADPNYSGRFTVPVLWDKKQNTIVSNESSEIIRMLNTEFNGLLPEKYANVDIYPEHLRSQIDDVNPWHYDDINNGVYKCGLGQTQFAYHGAVTKLFDSLDRVEAQLSQNAEKGSGPYYFGDVLTEVDVRLYVTLVRFDPVYVSLFKTNKKMIRYDLPHVHEYMRRLYWEDLAFKETTIMHHIKGHYFESLTMINPSGVVPEGPLPHILPLQV
ncbi:Glutathione S-transferase omega-like 2 [Cyphellophora attinorum]|uniref:Glutathione S-transferase omega-like 2 n=1 Tax=Cyphellophora attinorum TaxID=1664694 RepID=A0A0N0NJ03_9EURO|nr:Glutathione S-transferase omega-like 2 [Phialophora attinorum]KPI36348.1 Glutathione S-transferase omega-like 2 [Phialophora attinorum]